MVGEFEARIPDRRFDAITAFTHARVRQTNHREVGKSERDVHFNVDGVRVNSKNRGASQHGQQRTPLLQEVTRVEAATESPVWRGFSAADVDGDRSSCDRAHPGSTQI
jgi:hypothetical protein